MMTTSGCEGLIFLIHDKCSNLDGSKHNYLVLGTNENYDKLGLVQCMGITSMYHKDITFEVPIILSNDMVSYIVPYNLHSFSMSELDLSNFKGCITNMDYISKYEFMQLLMDLYADSLGLNLISHVDVMERYNKYCENFWQFHKDKIEFRHYKEETDIAGLHQHNEYDKEKETKVRVKSKHKRKRKRVKRARNKNSKENNQKIPIITIKDEKLSENDETTILDELSNINSVNITDINVYAKDLLNLLDVLNTSPRNLKDFSDKELILFLRGFIKYSYDEIKTIVTDRWNTASSLKSFYMACKAEALNRDLDYTVSEVLFHSGILNKPYSKWTDEELVKSLNYLNTFKNYEHILLEITGLSNMFEIQQRTYQIRKELTKRSK